MVGTFLYSEKIDSYKWRCFIPSNSAGKFVYIQASNLEGGKGVYWSEAILENQTPPQKFELILDTYPFGLALDVFKLYPDPEEVLTPTDGRVHAVYEEGTRVYITAQNYEDYVFEYWTGTGIEGTSSDNPLVTLMNQDKEYIAYYKEETEQPRLFFSPKDYNETLSVEETKSMSLSIKNIGTGVLYYNLSTDSSWLLVTPSEGSSSGETDEVVVTVDASSLDVGRYFGCVFINCSNGENATIPVNLTIVENKPVLNFSPHSYDFGSIGIGGCKKTNFFIWNSQEDTILDYKINITGLEDYVEVEPDSGSCEYTSPPQNISFTLYVKDLSPDDYEGSFLIESNGGVGKFYFNFSVVDIPSLEYYPNTLNVTCGIGKTVNKNLSISNVGTGVLYYNLSTDSSWLLVTPSEGSSSGETDEVVVTVDASSLDVGRYFGCVFINCSNGENATIPVNLTIVANPFLDFNPSSRILSGRKGDIITSFFYIQNIGAGSLQYTLTPDKSWIQLSTYSGYSSGEKDKIQITINTTLLNPGIYNGNISIECGSGGGGTFTITLYLSSPQPDKSIEIITPNGGENWQIGGVYEIRWKSTGNVGEKVKIELYRGNNLFKVLSTNISNVGNCKWVISTDIPPGYEYRIKISNPDNEEIYDFSDGVFSLYTPSTVHFLYLSTPPVCYEKQPFSITVYDEGGNVVKDAKVSLYGQNVVTDSEGKASPLFAPEVDRDTQIFIVANKLGYVYATATLLVKDVEKLIKIDIPKKIEEGKNFTVSVVFYNILDPQSPSYVVLDARVKFGNETKRVDEFGKVKLKAPEVDKETKMPLTVYVDYFDTYTNATLLVENTENMGILGSIKKVFTQTWLILFTIIFLTLLIVFIIISFRSKKRKINIVAPVHVGSNDEFIVRVKDNRDRGVEDALVEFNGVTKRTDNRGIVKFKAPNLAEIKELYITVEKDNMKDSVPIMVGSISPHKELYPYVTPPSITEEEIQIFSPIDKKQLKATQAKQAQTEELPQISTASNEIINKLIDAVLEKHKRK